MTIYKYEGKITGANIFWVTALLVSAFSALSISGGGLVNWSFLGYEVIFPFYMVIAVGEWGNFRADPVFEIISAQAESLFRWIFARYLYIFGVISAFAAAGMAAVCIIRHEVPFPELLITYISTALLFSSACALLCVMCRREHAAAAGCGVTLLFFMMAKAMLRLFPFTKYFYPFIRFVWNDNRDWLMNKCVLLFLSLIIWVLIFIICRGRKGIAD